MTGSRRARIAIVLVLLGAACTGGGTPRPSPSEIAVSTPASIPAPITNTCARAGTPAHHGGTVVFGAEQWPDCLNPITSCAASNWTHFTVLEHVLPRAMELDPNGNFVPSPLLVEAPSLANGGLAENPFTVRFRISDLAKWEDGSPITSADFAFTWRAILNTKGAYDSKGYDRISSIDSEDPSTAVITFDEVYADWPDVFGGVRGFVLKQAAFPAADRDKPDLSREMLAGIPFSGGPYFLKSWSKDQAVLVCNQGYFGSQALIDQLTFVPRTDQDKELRSIQTGEVAAIYPQPSDQSLLDWTANIPVKAIGGNGPSFEALWFNNSKAPLDDPAVRKALMFAVDRQSVIDSIVGLNTPDAAVLNYGFLALPGVGPWCGSKPFEQFTYDPGRAKAILEIDGYDCSSTPCTKDGVPLVVGYSTASTNSRRAATEALVRRGALAAGFRFSTEGCDCGTLIFNVGPRLIFTMADYTLETSSDPGVTSLLACDSIPTAGNSYSGGNWIHWCDENATALMKASDSELDQTKRLDDMNQIYLLEAQDFMSLPLYVVPAVSIWRTDQIDGPIGLYNSSPYGLFFNMNEWYVASA
jgi:peptide/nickel transport system substrate-binding protein